eukprot:9095969-Pyramimonas_sp.AAC.1
MPKKGGGAYVNPTTGALGGARYGATTRVGGVSTWVARGRMCTLPPGSLGRAPYGATIRVTGVPERGGGTHVDPATGALDELGGTERVKGVPRWRGDTHVDSATVAFGGAPHGATKRCTGWVKMPNWASRTHAA